MSPSVHQPHFEDTVLNVGLRLDSPHPLSGERRALPSSAQAIVIGAGIVGLSIAWRLQSAGLSTVVIEKATAGSGASLAATGMLAAAAELETGGEHLLPFALASQHRWPSFCAELEAASGMSIDLEGRGTLVVALTRDETERLRSRYELHRRLGLSTRWLGGTEARELEPGLRPSTTAALLCAQDHQVDPRLVMPALRKAFEAAGGTLVDHCSVDRVETAGHRCSGVSTSLGTCLSPVVVIAAGAHVAEGGLLPAGLDVPVRPLKGQSIALRADRASRVPDHIIWTEHVHISPRSGGRMIVGATVEDCGFDSAITAGGMFALLDGVRRALPGMEDMRVEAVWSGLRPTSADDAPILGETPVGGLLLAVGHHRNGILLAPETAEALVRLALGREIQPTAAPLGLSRFRRNA